MVTENGKTALFAGCVHCGIVNILKSAEDVLGRAPDAVFAGFHLYNPSLGKSEPDELVNAVGEKLCGDKVAHYFTGHCTGKEAYERLKRKLGDLLGERPAGSDFTV